MKSFLKTMACVVLLSMVSVTVPAYGNGDQLRDLLLQHYLEQRTQQQQSDTTSSAPFWKKVTGAIDFLKTMELFHSTYNMTRSLWSGEKQKKENPWLQQQDEGFFSYLARVSERGHRLLNGFDNGYEQLCNLYDRGCSLLGKKPKQKKDDMQSKKQPASAH